MISATPGAAAARLLRFPAVLLTFCVAFMLSPHNLNPVASLRAQRGFILCLTSRSNASYLPFSLPAIPPATLHPSPATDLTVHEWGTFTSIAGPDGCAMEWLPLSGPRDLPPFVEHLANTDFKGGLRGTIRMETPVLYFYSPHETTVSVHATFSKSFITEWYPRASVPAIDAGRDFSVKHKHTEGAITWKNVHVEPGGSTDFPTATAASHYYAARETSSAPLVVDTSTGPQREHFLFYRGVSAVLPPVTATIPSDNDVLLENHFPDSFPCAILFERRGVKLGYRTLGPLRDQASLVPPSLDGTLDSLSSDLEGMLVSQGLFPDEAHAMLETWKDSWFEEGSRIIYILPRRFVDSVLPLTITPVAGQLARVFVGRLELITLATQQAVESAFATNDRAMLAKYNRFLGPILIIMIRQSNDQARQGRLSTYLNSAYSEFYSQPRN
jgi:hypothetical protein